MQTAQASKISRTCLEVSGIDCLSGAADVVTLEYDHRRCRYRVAWIGSVHDGRAGRAGLESLDPISFIFDQLIPAEPLQVSASPQQAAPLPVNKPSSAHSERRRFQRYAWGANAQVRKQGIPINTPCKVTDISLGGCYVEMMSPFPEGTAVELEMFWKERTIVIDARVATSHPAIGMGVAFFGFSQEQFHILQELIESVSGKKASIAPPTEKRPTAVNPAQLTQDLLDWFDVHQSLSREQFEDLVQKQKPKNVSSASAANTGTG